MKRILLISLLFVLLTNCATNRQLSEVDRIKCDLIGQTMGGREKSWKFQSVEQIKDFKINRTIDDGENKIYIVSMLLHDNRVSESYNTDAKITYEKGKLKSVGLLYIAQTK